MTEFQARLLKAEERVVELEVENSTLNTTRDEAVTGQISVQEELSFFKSDTFKKNIIDDFKSCTEFHEKIGREVGSFLDKGYAHIIRQLHPYFEDKSILLRAFFANFDACRRGTDIVPFTSEEMEVLRERDEKRGRPFWNPPTPSNPTFLEILDGSRSTP